MINTLVLLLPQDAPCGNTLSCSGYNEGKTVAERLSQDTARVFDFRGPTISTPELKDPIDPGLRSAMLQKAAVTAEGS